MRYLFLFLAFVSGAFGATYDFSYDQVDSDGEFVERTVTLTPGTFLSISSNGTIQTQSTSAFKAALGIASTDITDFASAVAAVSPPVSWSSLTGKPTFATVATSGNYTDLTGRPSLAAVATSGSYTDLNNKPTLFSGAYSDLSGKPTLGTAAATDASAYATAAQGAKSDTALQAAWAGSTNITTLGTITNGTVPAANVSGLATVATSGNYSDLSYLPHIPADQVQSDWTASSGLSQILNKPTLASVATSGNYADLTNRPTIPAAQTNSDWMASSGVTQILNKPTLATVATSGSYNDLTNRPTLGTASSSNSTAFEAALGNPASDGMMLASTAAGVRSWVNIGVPLGPVNADVTGNDFVTFFNSNSSNNYTISGTSGKFLQSNGDGSSLTEIHAAAPNVTGLATVATTGNYTDLGGKPTLGTAASSNSTAFATSAQGAKADTALQLGSAHDPTGDSFANTIFFGGGGFDEYGTNTTAPLACQLADTKGNLYWFNKTALSGSDAATVYPEGSPLPLAASTGYLYFSNGSTLADSEGHLFGNGSNLWGVYSCEWANNSEQALSTASSFADFFNGASIYGGASNGYAVSGDSGTFLMSNGDGSGLTGVTATSTIAPEADPTNQAFTGQIYYGGSSQTFNSGNGDMLFVDDGGSIYFVNGYTLYDSTAGYLYYPNGTLMADSSGYLHGNGSALTGVITSIPTAATNALGCVKIDGTTITINGSGVISRNSSLGNVTAATLNKLTLTQPSTAATLTIGDNKTLAVNNTLTFNGTDGSTLNVGTGGTLGTAAFTAASAYATAAQGTKADSALQTSTLATLTPLLIGPNSISNATYSVAVGANNTVSGADSSAFGFGNTARSSDSSAVGYLNQASGFDSSALGCCNTANGSNYPSAFGYYNTASENRSSAFGYYNTASGSYSSAFGNSNTANGSYSSAFGYSINTSTSSTTEIGYTDSYKLRISASGFTFTGGPISGNGSSLTGLTKSQVGLGSVENTALSTWTGSANVTTIGTISSGTVPAARTSGFHTVATSGNYSDLINKPTLGTAAAQSSSAFEAALGNPGADGYVLSSTAAGVRSWINVGGGFGFGSTANATASDFLTFFNSASSNNYTISGTSGKFLQSNGDGSSLTGIHAAATYVSGLAAVATSGNYSDLNGLPSTTTTTTNATLTATSSGVICTGAGGIFIKLPAANANSRGQQLLIVNRTSGNVTLSPAGADLIEGHSNALISVGSSWTIASDATSKWYLY